MLLVGVDVGTQSLKAVVTDAALRPLGTAAVGYQPQCPRPGWAEQDPALWLDALAPAIGGALAAAGRDAAEVGGIGVAGQLDGCVPVDARGAALAPCLIWMDRRAAGALDGLDHAALRRRTGVVPDPIHMGPKLAWLRARGAAGAACWHQPVSFVVRHVCGASVMDAALASTTLLFDLARGDWADDLLAAFGASRAALPSVAGAGERAGTLDARGAALTGLRPGIPVAVGTGDDFASTLGGGVVAPGTLACTLGTAEVVGALAEAPLIDDGDLLETHPFPSGGYFLENPGWFGGGAVAWLTGVLGLPDAAALDRLAGTAPPGAEGLLFLPAMTGAMAPAWRAGARGAFYGLSPAHGAAHLARALLEGCAFAMQDVALRLRALGVELARVRLMGGGARGATWARIRADVSGLPVEAADGGDTSALGAAACAAAAAGAARTLAEAVARHPPALRLVEPDPGLAGRYADRHGAYRRLFAALEPMFEAP